MILKLISISAECGSASQYWRGALPFCFFSIDPPKQSLRHGGMTEAIVPSEPGW
jgi:hypothetical protein